MHLLSDIISAFGSRVGIGVHPGEKTAYLMRNTMYPGIPMSLEIGVRVGEQEYVLPLTKNGSWSPAGHILSTGRGSFWESAGFWMGNWL